MFAAQGEFYINKMSFPYFWSKAKLGLGLLPLEYGSGTPTLKDPLVSLFQLYT
jgi:hypothetical protein